MNEPQLIWRLARWIARRQGGASRLTWTGGEITIRLVKSKIIAIEGIEAQQLSQELGCEPAGHHELLQEAQSLAARLGLPETRTLAITKRLLAAALHDWLLDPQRQLELSSEEPDETGGPTISITHTMVEMVLSEADEQLIDAVLPDLDVLLRRHPNFLEQYSPLRLSEDADLIVAKVTGQRTAREVCSRSPHSTDEVVRLLVALVAGGMLEPVPVAPVAHELDLLPREIPETEITRRPLPLGWIVAGACAFVAMLAVISLLLASRGPEPSAGASGAEWSLVIDMGCDPQAFQRISQKASRYPSLEAVKVETGGEECWRLVWGRFSSQEEAVRSVEKVPDSFLLDGFDPHPTQRTDATDDLAAQE